MNVNPWIRLYRESLHDPKIVTLSDRQHRAWHNCLLITDDAGRLPPMRDIAVHMRVTVTEAEQLICELVEAELIDVEMLKGARVFTMHGWSARQYVSDSSTGRVKKFRERKRDETAMKRFSNADVTPPDPDPDSETDLNYPSSLDAARESEVQKLKDGLGLGRGGSVSVDARRAVCAQLAIGNADPLVALYDSWPPSGKARDPDALFKTTAEGFYRDAPPDVRKACLPLDAEPPPAPLPPVQASPSIRNSKLVRGFRHA